MISLVRVDDRVIHGQTITRWIGETSCDGIIIVDDELFENVDLGDVYRSVVPNNLKVFIFPVDKGLMKLEEAKKSQKKYLIIFRWVSSLFRVVNQGVILSDEVNVGPASTREDSQLAIKSIYLIPEEIEMYQKLWDKGIHSYFQVVPSIKKVWWNKLDFNQK